MSESSLKEVFSTKIDAVSKEVASVREIALEAKSIALGKHHCVKGELIEGLVSAIAELRAGQVKIVEELGHWKFFKRLFFVLVTLILGSVITGVVAFTSNSYELKTQTKIVSMKVERLNDGQRKLAKDIGKLKRVDDQLALDEHYELVKKALAEALITTKKKKR